MSRLSILLLLIAVVAVTAEDAAPSEDGGFLGQITSYFYTDSSTLKCGTTTTACGCNAFAFYECCEGKPTECCMRLQGWVVFIIVSILVSILFSCIGGIISCLCCCGRK